MPAIQGKRIVFSLALCFALLAALSGCGSAQPSPTSSTPQTDSPSNASLSSAPVQDSSAHNTPATNDPYRFSLGFAGDFCFADNYIPMQHLAALGSTDITDGIDQRYVELMRGMDAMWINNEFVYSNETTPLEGKAWTFLSKPENVTYLDDLGVDIVGLANNHTFDYGQQSFLDTLDTLKKANIPYTGAGLDEQEAYAPVYLQVDGFTIAYVNASSAEYTIYTPEATGSNPGIAWCYDTTKFIESIREADAHADFVIALPHWGTEHSTWLTDEQLQGAKDFIDAGADAVIGAHTHILQGLEYYQGKPIFYSLGNFWFDDYDIDTVVAELRISGTPDSNGKRNLDNAQVELVLYPGTQSGVFTSWASTEEERDRIFRYLESISLNVSIDNNSVVHEATQ